MHDHAIVVVAGRHFTIDLDVGGNGLANGVMQYLSHDFVSRQAARQRGRAGFRFDFDGAGRVSDHDHRIGRDLVGGEQLGQRAQRENRNR